MIPTVTPVPSSTPTITPIPPTPTVMPTPTPENIADSKDLSAWVDEFVHAYDGKVTVNGVEMDASQLTNEIRTNSNKFIESKQVNGSEVLFLEVNNIPLAMREGSLWQEATMANLSEMSGIIFEFSPRIPGDRIPQYISVLKKVAGIHSRFTFPSEMDTCHIYNTFSPDNWKSIITNWDNVQQDLNNGIIPEGYPYEWQGVYDIMSFAKDNVEIPQFRAQHLVEGRVNYCMLAPSIIGLWEKEKFSQAEMLKVLEFVVRTRVIQFPEVTSWDVQDEMIATYIANIIGGNSRPAFWLNATGKSPAELTITVAGWIKKDNPKAKTYVVEDGIFDNKYIWAQYNIAAFDQYIKDLHKNNAQVDGIISENNFWIFSKPDIDFISRKIDEYQSLGFEIGGAETMIVISDKYFGDKYRPKIQKVGNRKIDQADFYSKLLSLYIEKGIKIFGFGGIDDYNAWTNDVGYLDSDPLLFDDEFHAKPAYYAIVQVLYEQLP
jgi:GH35 family endo-1,4-beta-xylanase